MGSPVELRRVRRPRSMRAGLYAFGISLIEVLVFLPTPGVTCHGAYRISRCVKQPEPALPSDLV